MGIVFVDLYVIEEEFEVVVYRKLMMYDNLLVFFGLFNKVVVDMNKRRYFYIEF